MAMVVKEKVTRLLMGKCSMKITIITGRQRGSGDMWGGKWKRSALRLSKHSLTKSITSSQLEVCGSLIVVCALCQPAMFGVFWT